MAGDISAFTGKVPEGKEAFKVGFRVVEYPLKQFRDMDAAGFVKDGSGVRRMLDALIMQDDFVAISVNEYDDSLTPCKNLDGSYRLLVNKAVENPEQER